MMHLDFTCITHGVKQGRTSNGAERRSHIPLPRNERVLYS
jgi:hypothetical protein